MTPTPRRPPHFRKATDLNETCHTCAYIDRVTGVCNLYHWPVKRDDVCDSWKADTRPWRAQA